MKYRDSKNHKKEKIVIIGAGTSGLTIASNLSDRFNIFLIDKSEYKSYPFWYRPPLFIGLLLSKVKSKFIRKRFFLDKNGRNIPFFESNLVGGASVINGCVHMFGSKKKWDKILNPFGFTLANLYQSYIELFTTNNDKNKINLSYARQNFLDYAFIKSLASQGIYSGDSNYSDVESCGPIINTSRRLFRSSVLSIANKKKFKILLKSTVEDILFNDKKEVIGVKVNGKIIRANNVIISAGVIGSCSLMMKIQNRESYLKELQIGQKIRDHTNIRINVLANKKLGSLNEISSSYLKKISLVLRHFFGFKTLIQGTGATTSAHLDLNNDGEIDVRIQIVNFFETGRHGSSGKIFDTSEPGFSISITAINPRSYGNVRFNNSGEVDVDPNYLNAREDVEVLIKALTFSMNILKSPSLSKYVKRIIDEDKIINSPESYIKENFYSGYHLIGGLQNSIREDFSVKGCSNLYVCDASIFEDYVASNIHSSVVLVSSLFSKRLKESCTQC